MFPEYNEQFVKNNASRRITDSYIHVFPFIVLVSAILLCAGLMTSNDGAPTLEQNSRENVQVVEEHASNLSAQYSSGTDNLTVRK
jgi:hypothetical protein